jgi:hypothetical protein
VFNTKSYPYIAEEVFKVKFTELNVELREVDNNDNVVLEWSFEAFLAN